jgi:hypothetical protein
MPIVRIQLPDGRIARIEVPEGATPQEIESFAAQQFPTEQQPPQALPDVNGSSEFGYISPQQAFTQAIGRGAIPFGKRAVAAIGAGVASPFVEDMGYGQLYEQALRQQDEAARQQPAMTIAGTLTGGVFSAPLIPGGGGLASSTGKAAALGGATALGETQDLSSPGAMYDSATGALTAASLNMVLRGLGRTYQAVKPRKPPSVTSKDLADQARSRFKEVEQMTKGAEYTPQFVNRYLSEVQQIPGLVTRDPSNIATFGRSQAEDIAQKMQATRTNKPMSFAAMQETAQRLGRAADDFVDPVTGRITDEGRLLGAMQSRLMGAAQNLQPGDFQGPPEAIETLKKANDLWRRSFNLGDIERLVAKASYTENPATSLRVGFRNIASTPGKLQNYPEAQKLIERAATVSPGVDFLKGVAGSRLNPIAWGAASGPAAGAAAALGAAGSRSMATNAQLARAYEVMNAIAGTQPVPELLTPQTRAALGNILFQQATMDRF